MRHVGGLVGRSREEAVLLRCLEATRAGESCVLALSGDPGMGKSTLLGVLVNWASEVGVRALSSRVGEFERTVPFGVLTDALDGHIEDLPDLWSTERIPDRYVLYRAVRGLLADIAGERGLVLALDDLHWADDGSIGLISHLVRHPPAAALLLACAFRPRQLSQRLRDQLDHSALVERLELGPLDLQRLKG